MIGKTVSHYKILEKLGEGGMGVVYKAEDLKLKRIVALKFLPPDLTRDPGAKERFVQEAQAASALDHSNICTIYEINEADDGRMFISMACYTGETLKERIDRGPLPIKEAMGFAEQIARGLSKAHESGIVHRDIKPANIFVTNDNEIKIFDFGLAKLSGQIRLTRAGTTIGTAAYMAPEQTTASDVDERADIWSFGVVLYEMVTGALPFKGEHEQAVMYSILNRDPEPLTSGRPDAPADLERVVAGCLEKTPADRYQNIDDVIANLKSQTGPLQETSETSLRSEAHPPGKRRVTDRWMGIILTAIIAIVIAYAFYWQLTLKDKKNVQIVQPQRVMLVVLPFQNLGPSDVEYFADGMTEEITSRLATLRELGVISRTSAIQYKDAGKSIKQIGDELGVDYVLEGTVRWDRSDGGESRVRVTPQLIRVSDDTHLWTDRYDRVLEDIFDVQSEIAIRVTEQLNITLLEPERQALEARPTKNMEAYEAYLRGCNYAQRAGYSRDLWRLAIEMFARAVALDPEFALAYASLANAHSSIYNMGMERTEIHRQKTKDAVDRALTLQPELPEAHAALGYYYYHCLSDFDSALKAFETASKWLPNKDDLLQQVGWIRRRQGRWDEALDNVNKSLELNPRDASLWREVGNIYNALRNYEEARNYYDQSIALAPDQVAAYVFKAWGFWLESGDTKRSRLTLEAIPVKGEPIVAAFWFQQEMFDGNYQAAIDKLNDTPVELIETPVTSHSKAQVAGFAYQMMGEKEKARKSYEAAREVLERTIEMRPGDHRVHSSLGVVYAALGRKEDALREGKRAVEMMPVSVDALGGPRQIEHLAVIYMFLGDFDAAVEKIDYLLSIPCFFSVQGIQIDPTWDPLRDDPKFQAVLLRHSKANP